MGVRDGGRSSVCRDIHFDASVSTGSFTGECSCYVSEDDWDLFVEDLTELGKYRVGNAELRSMSPDEFEFCITNSSNRKIMKITGIISAPVTGQRLEFSFEAHHESAASFAREVRRLNERIE